MNLNKDEQMIKLNNNEQMIYDLLINYIKDTVGDDLCEYIHMHIIALIDLLIATIKG